MVSRTPTYGLPYIDPTDKPREIAAQEKAMALEIEKILAEQGRPPLASDLPSLVARLLVLERAAKPGAWTNVGFASGWGNHPNTAVWGTTQYRVIGTDYLELRGEIQCPSGYGVDATMFTLPAGARPPRNLQVLALDNANATPAIVMVGIRADGSVTLAPAGKQFINLTIRVPLS